MIGDVVHQTRSALDHIAYAMVRLVCTIAGVRKRGDESRRFGFRKHPIKAGTAVMDLGWPTPQPPPEVDVQRASPLIVFSETDGLCDQMSIFPIIRGGIKVGLRGH